MAESTILKDIETGKVDRQCRYFKAAVLEDHKTDDTDQSFKDAIDDVKTIIFTDKSTLYLNIADYVEIHITEKSNKQTTK